MTHGADTAKVANKAHTAKSSNLKAFLFCEAHHSVRKRADVRHRKVTLKM